MEKNILMFAKTFFTFLLTFLCLNIYAQIDLSLQMSASDPNPGAYNNTEVTVTINNNGSSAATNVSVEFPKPPQAVYTGGNEWTATKGTFKPFDDEQWTVGNLPAGASESITVSYFTLSDSGVTAYAQVSSANGSDSDSTPGNGTCCTANEDDEAALGINGGSGGGGGSCTITASVANMNCNDWGTPNDPSDDRFNVQFNVLASGTECGNSYQLDGEPVVGDYGAVGSFFGFYPIAEGPRTFTIRDYDDSQYFTTITVTPPAPCSNGGGGGGDIDLELSLSQPNTSPDQWSSYQVTATLSNTGGQTATGIKVQFPKPSGVVYTGGNEYTVSQGSFQPFGADEWNVGSIPAGGSATLNVNYFLTAASAPTAYAQVSAANENDDDSTPGNGTPPTPNEDDEASTSGGGGNNCAITATFSNVTCSNNGTPNNSSDDEFSFTVEVSNNGNCSNVFTARDNGGGPISSFTYGTRTFGQYPISGGAITIDFNDQLDLNATTSITVNPPATCSNGSGGGDGCGFFTFYEATNVDNFFPAPIWTLEEDASGYSIYGNQSRFELDLEGNVLSDAEELPTPSGYDVSVEVDANENVSLVFNQSPDLPTGTVVPIDIDYSNPTVVYVNSVAQKTMNGYVFGVGIVDVNQSPNIINRVIQTDDLGQNVVISQLTDSDFYGGYGRVLEGPDGSIFTEWTASGNFSLFTIPADGSPAWQVRVASDTPSSRWKETEASLDGEFVYTMKWDNAQTFVAKYEVSTGNLVGIDLIDLKQSAVPNGFRRTWAEGIEPTADGGLLVSLRASEVIGGVPDFFVLAKYDANDNIVWKNEIPDANFGLTPLGETSDGGALFGGGTGSFSLNGEESVFIKVTEDGELTPECDGSGGGQQPDLRVADLKIENSPINAGQVLTYNFDASNIGNAAASGNFKIKGYISTDAVLSNNDIQDGTISTGNYGAGVTIADVPGASTIPANLAAGQYYLILKIDADNQIGESNENNNTVAKPFTVSGGGTGDPCDNISVSTGDGEMTIAHPSAAHVIIKVFAPNWATVFDCLDNSCSSPQYVGGLNGGTHYVSVKLLDAGWQEICKYEEFINVPNPVNGGGGNFLSVPDFLGRPVRLLGIQPNPAFHGETTAVILSNEEGLFDLDVYDVFGRKAISQKIELEKGRNEIRLDISDFRDGTYYLNMPGENWRHMPVRFVVTRW